VPGRRLTHGKKIAALAEAHHVGVVPHNPKHLDTRLHVDGSVVDQ
jgi:hypothetical protein